MVELASQWREGEMLPRIEFPGFSLFYEFGFSTDISETCVWITPHVKQPGDPQDFR